MREQAAEHTLHISLTKNAVGTAVGRAFYAAHVKGQCAPGALQPQYCVDVCTAHWATADTLAAEGADQKCARQCAQYNSRSSLHECANHIAMVIQRKHHDPITNTTQHNAMPAYAAAMRQKGRLHQHMQQHVQGSRLAADQKGSAQQLYRMYMPAYRRPTTTNRFPTMMHMHDAQM
jgi:hypothetical protein